MAGSGMADHLDAEVPIIEQNTQCRIQPHEGYAAAAGSFSV
jgi:hypothetical protein